MSITLQNDTVILTGFDRFRYKPLSIPKNLWKHRKIYLNLTQVESYIEKHPKTRLTKKLQSMVVRPSLKIHLSEISFDKWKIVDGNFPWESTTLLKQFINAFSKELEGGKLSLNKVVQRLQLFNLLTVQFENEVWDMQDIHDRYTGLQVAEILRGNLVKATEKVVNQINALSFGYSGKKAAINSQKLHDLVDLCNPGRAIKQMRSFINRQKIEEFQKESDPKFKEFMLRRWVSDYGSVRRYEVLAKSLSSNSNEILRNAGDRWLKKSAKAFDYVHNQIFPEALFETRENDQKESNFVRVEEEGKTKWIKAQDDTIKGKKLEVDFRDTAGMKAQRDQEIADMDIGSSWQYKFIYRSLMQYCTEAGYKEGELYKILIERLSLLKGKDTNTQTAKLFSDFKNALQSLTGAKPS
ncbi:hypothetical protein [uncultured Endozoicomonas sp.]|uniref:hypothetical protein n=1 Tax=uncultured Endozoicomonas sp. TaxID=432652 RepID=UPI0026208E42|nr:hypothetical protein [uncultured Endozoicomonas sp.]